MHRESQLLIPDLPNRWYATFFVCYHRFWKIRGIYSVLWPCTVACTVQNTMFVHPCFSISRTPQFCFWRRGGTCYISAPCKTHSFWFPIFAHMRSKCCNVDSFLGASSLEDESVFGLGSWHVQKGICPSLCFHIHKPKNIPRVLQKKQPSFYMLSNHTWSPGAPLINVVAQCMPASEPKWFFWRLMQAKRCNNIAWGEGACKFLRNDCDRMAVIFGEPGMYTCT